MFGAQLWRRTLFLHKQYRGDKSEKEKEADLCKQTEIVGVPIRLNRKPSQLTVYSEPGFGGRGLHREHFLDGHQTDGAASGGRWQLRHMRVCHFITGVYKGQQSFTSKKMSSFLIADVHAKRPDAGSVLFLLRLYCTQGCFFLHTSDRSDGWLN